jgi:hypothetical protein
MRNDLLEWEVAILRAMQRMREEMNRVWKDFFEKNPDKREEVVWNRVEERFRNEQNSKGQGKGVIIDSCSD